MVNSEHFARVVVKPFFDRGYTLFLVCHGAQPKFTVSEIVQDIHRAVRFVRVHAKDHCVDPNRLGIMGASSGGFLALSIGTGGINRQYDGPGAFVGAHGGPCPYEDPVVIHPPNSPLGHSDQMQSLHPGGANILMGDGAVRFYSDSHKLSTWAALVSRNGGEVIDEDY